MKAPIWNKIYTPIIIALVFVIGMSVGRQFLSTGIKNLKISPNSSKIDQVLDYINQDYVDSVQINLMEDKAITDIVSNLDPHSSYIPPEDFHSVVDPLMGNFEGIGIQFRMIRDSLTVMLPILGGPSEKVGIKAGDRIVIADGDTIANRNMDSQDIVKRLKGARGSKVNLKIHRSHEDSLLAFTVIRDVIPTFSIDAKFMVNDTVGYLKISKFSATTIEEFDDAMAFLKNQGMKKLILDLRGNTGGYLKAAINISDAFLKKGQLIVFTKGNNRPERRYFASDDDAFEDGDLVLLIDENSASASEIVAGAIQDNDRGLLIGRRSFGKGLVQEQMNFTDGSAIRLTVARYYAPSGRCIQRSYAEGTDAYYADHYHQMLADIKAPNDTVIPQDTTKYTTMSGKIVFGGGGITPDIILSIDTTFNYYFYNRLLREGIIVEFAIDYYNQHRKDLEAFNNTKEFYLKYQLNNSLYQQIIKRARDLGVSVTDVEAKKNQKLVMNILKAEIARFIFNDEAYFYVYLQEDEGYQKAVNQ